MQSTRYSCPIVMKLEFMRQIIEICSNTKVNENSFSGTKFFHAVEETERQI
jgi:hypothetical protein